jgi:putative heme-binding domain-containing protein
LPNSLTWGPDGYLYGLNGVFNRSVVKQNGKTFNFTCAMFRIHPRTKEFSIFCEGTSNPWGIAFNENGDAFVSACVIDHLWHLVETGYYHRQGGPYPPFTWKIGSIVNHKHQKAAYCGLVWFDSDAYPEEYRGKLFMGNIHGNCINSDELTRDGSTYFAKPRPDFLTANDAWFMPVVQKVGPDGCLYILDWYDRYHCYQDANRDPAGIDRLRGRLYRVRYKDTPRAASFDLQQERLDRLTARLGDPNIFFRESAQRILLERFSEVVSKDLASSDRKTIGKALEKVAIDLAAAAPIEAIEDDPKATKAQRMRAVWFSQCLGVFTAQTLADLNLGPPIPTKDNPYRSTEDPIIRAWGVRTLGNTAHLMEMPKWLPELADDRSRDVLLQVAIVAPKFKKAEPISTLLKVLVNCGDDKLIPHIVWQNLHPILENKSDDFLAAVAKVDLEKAPAVVAMMPRIIDRLLGAKTPNPAAVVAIIDTLSKDAGNAKACGLVVASIANRIQNGELAGTSLKRFQADLMPILHKNIDAGRQPDLATEVMFLGATLKDPAALKRARENWKFNASSTMQLKALDALIFAEGAKVLDEIGDVWSRPHFAAQILPSLGRIDSPQVATVVLKQYPTMAADLQPSAIDLLTQRSSWSKRLLAEIEAKKIPPGALNVNQVRKLLASKDVELVKQVTRVWGTVRETRNPEREKVVADMREMLKKTPGDAFKGQLVFKKLCAQCHKLHGEGADVGPDITSNGRSDFDQLLSNVFDPSLVIGAGYRATQVVTTKGTVLSGLLVEDSPQRVVLKTQGGKIETIARGDVEQVSTSKLSYMPEDVERQLSRQEIADLFALLVLDRPPSDPMARKIPGSPR